MGGTIPRRKGRWLGLLLTVTTLAGVMSSAGPAGTAAAGTGKPKGEVFRSVAPSAGASTATVPDGFQDSIAWSGLTNPTAITFAPDGKVYVAQKLGFVKVFSSVNATTPTVFANLSNAVDDYWDRGLLGLAVDPQLGTPGHNFIYVLYTYDAPPGRTHPVWRDACPGAPDGPGPTTDGCVVTGRLSRIPVNADGTAGTEQVLLGPDWCQQYPSHSVGHLAFLPDGSLLVSAGEGASFTFADYGQAGGTVINPATGQPYTPANPCNDPPNGLGVANTAPNGRGGALRSQSLRRPAGEPILLDGTLLRVDPATGNGLPGNPLYNSANPAANAGRIVAFGLRNPFRFAVRPGTAEVWIADVGWDTWEEINRLASPTPAAPVNFGWPCYEGSGQTPGYAGLAQCIGLYQEPDSSKRATAPYAMYSHGASVVQGDGCSLTEGSVISALAFAGQGNYPSTYNGALFFGDHSRSCIWAMLRGANGLPDPTRIQPFLADPASRPVDLEADPDSGDLFYASFEGNAIHRIRYFAANQPPVAVATANPTNGPAPLAVFFDGTGSSDADDSIASYSWNFGDGSTGSGATAWHTYTAAGTYPTTLTVQDTHGATGTSVPISISAGNTPPVPVIDTPAPSLTYATGDRIDFTGHATDQQDGTLTGGRLVWRLVVHHCTTGCHTHALGTVGTGTSGSFTAPDHDYPSHLELRLTATDSNGLAVTTNVELQPKTVALTFHTLPLEGMKLTVGSSTLATPFTMTVIRRSVVSISALAQKYKRKHYVFSSWSDGGAATHNITAPTTPASYTATFLKRRAAT